MFLSQNNNNLKFLRKLALNKNHIILQICLPNLKKDIL